MPVVADDSMRAAYDRALIVAITAGEPIRHDVCVRQRRRKLPKRKRSLLPDVDRCLAGGFLVVRYASASHGASCRTGLNGMLDAAAHHSGTRESAHAAPTW